MIVWALGGIAVGLVASTRLRVDRLVAVLVASIALPAAAVLLTRRFDPDLLTDYLVFWLAVQGAYLAGNLLAERRAAAEKPRETRPLGEA